MTDEHERKLYQILEDDDLSGLSFLQSKTKLLKLGYSDDEISIAVANRPFDGKKNMPKPASHDEKMLAQDPDAAQEVARELLAMDAKKRQAKIRAKAMITQAWGSTISPMSTNSMVGLSSSLGIPIFSFLFGGLMVAAVSYGLHTFGLIGIDTIFDILKVYTLGIGALIVVKYIASEIRFSRLKTGKARLLDLLQVVFSIELLILLTYLPGWLARL